MVRGGIASEVVIRIADGTEICAVITEGSRRALKLRAGEAVWAAFSRIDRRSLSPSSRIWLTILSTDSLLANTSTPFCCSRP